MISVTRHATCGRPSEMRHFKDRSGTAWTVWEVRPRRGLWTGPERRSGLDRRTALAASPLDRRTDPERRASALRVIEALGPELADGWLAFHAPTERRRLVPVPEGWTVLRDAELAELCARADRIAATDEARPFTAPFAAPLAPPTAAYPLPHRA